MLRDGNENPSDESGSDLSRSPNTLNLDGSRSPGTGKTKKKTKKKKKKVKMSPMPDSIGGVSDEPKPSPPLAPSVPATADQKSDGSSVPASSPGGEVFAYSLNVPDRSPTASGSPSPKAAGSPKGGDGTDLALSSNQSLPFAPSTPENADLAFGAAELSSNLPSFNAPTHEAMLNKDSKHNSTLGKSARRRRTSVTGLTEIGMYWYDVMTRYGNVETANAMDYSSLFGQTNLPYPSPDASVYLTHELLSSLGVVDAGDRCRIMLACARMPELKHRDETGVDESQSLAGASTGAFPKDSEFQAASPKSLGSSYEVDTQVVKMRTFKPADGSFEWIDLVGKDMPDLAPEKEPVAEGRRGTVIIPTKVEESKNRDTPLGHSSSRGEAGDRRVSGGSGGSTDNPLGFDMSKPTEEETEWEKKFAEIAHILKATARCEAHDLSVSSDDEIEEGTNGDRVRKGTMPPASPSKGRRSNSPNTKHLSSPGSPRSIALGEDIFSDAPPAVVGGVVLLRDLLDTKLPLPQLRIDRTQPSRCGFVLRVCTLDVEEEDDTMRSLTNRWTIYVDAANKQVITIHRVDSLALSGLRDTCVDGVIPHGLSFNAFLAKLIEQFVAEYEKALDAAEEWLDSCEAAMLSSSTQVTSTSDDLLTSLFHLQRRASVYDRMVILSRGLIEREIARHLNLGDELEVLGSRFQQLQEKTVDLGSRAQNLLEIHLSLTGYHTNELMKMLTKFSMFFTPITFLAGVWGMNFEYMPELQLQYGYFLCLGVMLIIAIGMVVWFRWAKI